MKKRIWKTIAAVFFNKACIMIGLICLLIPQESFSQDILGKWECPEGMYQYWGYKTGKANITFNKDNTFVLKVKARNMRIGLAGRQRRMITTARTM